MSDRSAALLIEDILESAKKIQRYTAGMTFEQFTLNEKTADASLEISRSLAKRQTDYRTTLRKKIQT